MSSLLLNPAGRRAARGPKARTSDPAHAHVCTHVYTHAYMCAPQKPHGTHAHASRLCRGPQGNTSEGRLPLPWLLRPLPPTCPVDERTQGAAPTLWDSRHGRWGGCAGDAGREGAWEAGAVEASDPPHPSRTGERPQLKHLQIKDQVVEPFLGDAVVQPHCGDRKGREGLAQPGTRPRRAAPLPCGGAHPSR